MINRIAIAALSSVLLLSGTASAQTQPTSPTTATETRKEHRSDHSLRRVSRSLEHEIDALEHDQHDYAGHRVAAINALKQAREEIRAALQADQNK